ncbi:MAG: RDD family protein [Porticoccaceae bacterium]
MQDPHPQSSHLPNAGLVRRLMALVYDGLLLLGVAFAYGVLVWIIRKLGGDNAMEALTGIAAYLQLLGLWLVLAGYYVLCWRKRGQTLGMKSWRLRLQTPDGHYIDAPTAWLRCILAPLSALPLGLGYLWCQFGKSRSCWHDIWTQSRVVVLPKDRNKRSPSTTPG